MSYILMCYILCPGAGLETGHCNADLLRESRLRMMWEIWVSCWMLVPTGMRTSWPRDVGALVNGTGKVTARAVEATW